MNAKTTIPLCKPLLEEEECSAALTVLKSGMLVQGEQVARFEAKSAELLEQAHIVACSNGTSALYLALKALGIKKGDEVLCPALTWPSPANAIALCGATVVLVDVDRKSWNMDPAKVPAALSAHTKAAIVVDQFGMPADYDALEDALGDIPLVEDAACSLGSSYRNKACGSLGSIATVSFHPRKIVTTAEGGLCATNRGELATRMRTLRNHGQSRPGEFEIFAHNFRLTEMAAAIGSAQLDRLGFIVDKRRSLALRYKEKLPKLTWQHEDSAAKSNYQTMGFIVDESDHPSPEAIISALTQSGIQAGKLSYDLSALSSLEGHRRIPTAIKEASRIAAQGLALPLYPQMTTPEQDRVINALNDIIGLS
ncbi:MAG: DegT/DnrJ/EryC1/StrS family aminotransferase [Myxococcales bacterium]|nr:MAG: DegT/DnrJ/EryC1/StrS family aminotransferase [Myxococcales bacterium]